MKKKLVYAASLSLIAVMTAPAVMAQTATPNTNSEQPVSIQQAIEEKLIMAQPATTQDVPNTEVIQIDLTFKDVKDLPPDVSTSGVMIKGYTRYVDVNGKQIGQLVLTGLEKDLKTVDLDHKTFTSQFDFKEGAGTQLSASDQIEVNGNREQLIEALRKLNEEEVAAVEDGEDGEDSKENAENPERGTPSSNASQNEQAANYSTPERLPAPDEPTEEFRTTTEGCKVRVDIPQEIAAQQSRVQHIVDGAVQDEGTCADSGTNFPLKKNYQFCTTDVDIEAKKATAYYEWFYTNDQAQYQKASDCQADPEKVFPIIEKHGVCPTTINVEQETATPQSKLVYLGLNGIEEQVRDCSPSAEKPAITMTQNFDSCKIKHDFTAGRSQEMAAWVYEQDGTIFQATPCLTTETKYNHTKVYKKGGNDICTPIVDLVTNSVVLQSRVEITRNGVPEYITECTPDTGGASLSILSTTEGCEDPRLFDHDLVNQVSHGRKRFYYENPGRVYVSECQIATDLPYAHTRTISGYSNQDQLKAAYELTTVTIDVNGAPFEMANSIVMAGAVLVPYEFKETREDVVDNQYEGCSVTRITAEVEVYKRPDETEYKEAIGTGTPQGPFDACGTVIQQPVWILQSETHYIWTGYSQTLSSGTYNHEHAKSGIYSGSRILQREDGAEISQTSKSTRSAVCHKQWTGPHGAVGDHKYRANGATVPVGSSLYNRYRWTNPPCPSSYTGGDVYSWNQGEGW